MKTHTTEFSTLINDDNDADNVNVVNNINDINEIVNMNGLNVVDNVNGINEFDNINGFNNVNDIDDVNGINGSDNVNGINEFHNINGFDNVNDIDDVNDINGSDNMNGINEFDNINGFSNVNDDDMNGINDSGNVNSENYFNISEENDYKNSIIKEYEQIPSDSSYLLNESSFENKNKDEIFPEQLKIYYRRLFPYDTFCRWLEYKHEVYLYKYSTFKHREFSFNLEGGVYSRFNSFSTKDDFIKAVQKQNPIKIDIGAEYNRPASEMFKLIPERKEVVIDIDISDYNDVRKCCKGTNVCQLCWKYMNLACKILDVTLREDFGFEHILWVFSGRRGIHCWICDTKARHLDSRIRSSVAEYLNRNNKIKFLSEFKKESQLINCIKRAINIIDQSFIDICINEQKLLETTENVNEFLISVHESVRNDFKKEIMKYETSFDRWNAVVNYYDCLLTKNKLPPSMRNFINLIKIKWCYPRLDINVTKGLNHLLKSPFCVHPNTGKICVPINPKIIEKFNPSTAPTIEILLDEINSFDSKLDPEVPDFKLNKINDARKTSLIKSLVVFEQFVSALERT